MAKSVLTELKISRIAGNDEDTTTIIDGITTLSDLIRELNYIKDKTMRLDFNGIPYRDTGQLWVDADINISSHEQIAVKGQKRPFSQGACFTGQKDVNLGLGPDFSTPRTYTHPPDPTLHKQEEEGDPITKIFEEIKRKTLEAREMGKQEAEEKNSTAPAYFETFHIWRAIKEVADYYLDKAAEELKEGVIDDST